MMKDKKRLLDIINLIEPGKSVIDIGTDHGLVPLYLAKNGISEDILATDISAPSLKKLEDELDDKLREVIETRITDGFDGIEAKKNQIAIIAGMGGNTIIDIIDRNIDFAKGLDYMLLASNVATEALRKYLIANGFTIERDFISFENKKYYDILKVMQGSGQELSLADIYYGFENIEKRNQVLVEKLAVDLEKNTGFRDDILKHSAGRVGIDRITERIDAINEVYDRWKLEN